MTQRRDLSDESYMGEEDRNSSSEEYQLNSKVQSLHSAFLKLKDFLSHLSSDRETQLEQEIVAYCGKAKELEKTEKEVLHLCEKRIEKMLRNKKTKKNWNEDDINILVWVVNRYTSQHEKKSIHLLEQNDWKFISELIPATTWKKCMFKWLSLKKFSLLTHRWTNIESQILTELIQKHGKKDWKRLSEQLYASNSTASKVFRTPKQCREHWNCYLNPSIRKGPWKDSEDIKLLETVLELNCLKKWSEVAKSIKGRTENAVKNRFTLLIEKERKVSGVDNQKNLINRMLARLIQQGSGLEAPIKSEELDALRGPNLIFQESENRVKSELKKQKPAAHQGFRRVGAAENENEKVHEALPDKLIIPTVHPAATMYPSPAFYPVRSEFHPCFFGFMYGNQFNMK